MSDREEFYVYDGDDVALDFVDANGATGGVSPVLKTRYLQGPAVDQILAQEELEIVGGTLETADVLWMLTDHLGSVRDIVNQEGEAVSHVTYDAFGNIVGGTGVLLTRYLYTGRELDTLTGLQYNRNRWYDPALGRWISEDPIGFWGGDYNLGRYVRNVPISSIDPSGLAELAPIDLGDGVRARVDRGNPFGGFEIHVYRNGEEIAKLDGQGKFVETHQGKELQRPSEFRSKFPKACKAVNKLARKEAQRAFAGGLRVGAKLTYTHAQKPPAPPRTPKPPASRGNNGVSARMGSALFGLTILTDLSGTYGRAREAGRTFWEQWRFESLTIKSWSGRLDPEECRELRMMGGFEGA